MENNGKKTIQVKGGSDTNLTQLITLKIDGQYYMRVRGRINIDNNSPCAVMRVVINWRFAAYKADWHIGKSVTGLLGEPDAAEVREYTTVFTVPDEAPVMFLNLNVRNQDKKNSAYWDSVELYKLERVMDTVPKVEKK